MMNLLETLKHFSPVLTDAWYVVDAEDRIVDFNPAFFALFPRSVARGLHQLPCREALRLSTCGPERCVRHLCSERGSVRMDEVQAEVGGESLRFIVSAVPVSLPTGDGGALIVLRNVTDEARVQARYQALAEEAEKQRVRLQEQLDERTRELLSANEALNRLEREIAALRRGL